MARKRTKRKKKIAIVGKAPSSWALAPYGDDSWEIWVLNDLAHDSQVKRWDKHFDIHDLDIHRNDERYGKYWEWMKETDAERPGDITLRAEAVELPNASIYPVDEIVQHFGRYFTNSIAWMIALAIREGATELGLYGVDMAQHGVGLKSEYAQQRPSCEFLVGWARGLGIAVHIPKESDLMKCRRLYGFSDPGDMEAKMTTRMVELQQRQNEAKAAAEEAGGRAHQALGAIRMLQELKAETNGEVAALLDERMTKHNELLQVASKDKAEAQTHHDIYYGALDNMAWVGQWS